MLGWCNNAIKNYKIEKGIEMIDKRIEIINKRMQQYADYLSGKFKHEIFYALKSEKNFLESLKGELK